MSLVSEEAFRGSFRDPCQPAWQVNKFFGEAGLLPSDSFTGQASWQGSQAFREDSFLR